MDDRTLAARLWSDLGGDPSSMASVVIGGPQAVLPSTFDVTGFASATVAVAATAVAELAMVRQGLGSVPPVAVDRLAASAAFRFEGLVRPDGWELPPIWDPVAGDYRATNGWIRLHTNYANHRRATLAVLEADADRAAVAAAVERWDADELESAVVAAGGCAAALRTSTAWAAHPAGVASRDERPMVIDRPVPISGGTGPDRSQPVGASPLAGLRVLDLTRVIAGPLGTRYLAGYGADVVRIDPPGFEEVPALLPEVTAGKRCAALDLADGADRARFEALVARADVVVGGLRPGALAELGYGAAGLRAINPGLVTVAHDAYGWSGPWAGRRGFDSLVQMSTGIAAAGAAAAGVDRPTPLPAQALDHGVGHLVAAAACRGLVRRIVEGVGSEARGSLVGAANVVSALAAPEVAAPAVTVADADLVDGDTAWGPLRRVPLAGRIGGYEQGWSIEAGPLGRHLPEFAT